MLPNFRLEFTSDSNFRYSRINPKWARLLVITLALWLRTVSAINTSKWSSQFARLKAAIRLILGQNRGI